MTFFNTQGIETENIGVANRCYNYSLIVIVVNTTPNLLFGAIGRDVVSIVRHANVFNPQ